jgi:hypothetical protein
MSNHRQSETAGKIDTDKYFYVWTLDLLAQKWTFNAASRHAKDSVQLQRKHRHAQNFGSHSIRVSF